MRLRAFMTAGAVLVCAASGGAQSAAPVVDQISGTWVGLIGPGTVPNYAITLQLTFDGQSVVSGTGKGANGELAKISGTFDSKTNALKILGQVEGDTNRLTFEGVVASGTVTGRATPSGDSSRDGSTIGVFIFTKKDAGTARAATAPPSPTGPDAAAALRKRFAEASGWVTKAADLVPADKYAYQPVKTVRTFGQLVGHVADAYTYFCGQAAGKKVQWSDAIANGRTDKATLVPKLKQATDGCAAVYAGDATLPPLIENIGHTDLHYGNMVTYMRMLGLVPPSSS